MVDGSALDLGGTRARLYHVAGGVVLEREEIALPGRREGEGEDAWGRRRVDAIAELVRGWKAPCPGGRIPTACAGRKDAHRESVVLSFYASPLPDLVPLVKARTGLNLGPLYDDDVCAGWGHRVHGHIDENTLILTAGTGVAESLWVEGRFLDKGSYPRLSELGLEDQLRAAAWKDGELPLEALEQVVAARCGLARLTQVILSGRFAQRGGWPERLAQSGLPLRVLPLDEAPALGALALSGGISSSPEKC